MNTPASSASQGWTMRFAEGEVAARRAAGEWTGETLGDMARLRAADTPGQVAVIGEDASLTFADLLDQATALARGLLETGIERGDTVSFQLPNWTEAIVIDLACALAGFVINPVIPIYRQSELRFILKDCRARLIFVPESFRGIDYPEMIAGLRDELPGLAHVAVTRGARGGTTTYDAILAAGRASTRVLEEADADAAKFIMYTSGTTGRPKGVIYSQNQQRRPLWASFTSWGLKPGSRLIMPSPVTHVTGFSYGMEMPILFGTRTTFMEKWDAARAAEIIDEQQIEFMIGATPFLAELVEQAERSGTRLPSLRIFACGGAAVPPEIVRRAHRAFAQARVFRCFGSSECPMITQGTLDDPELAATTDGRIFDWDVKIVDGEGRRLDWGAEGEILARGPSLFRGYTDADANREAFDAEGYFRTGDLGTVSADGIITITGRKKDIIIRGGENLSAKEIEDALHEHPAIREAAVVAIPHPRLGEGVGAYVIPSGEARPDRDAVAAWLKERGLAPQKWPERIDYVDALPKTASGKVQKHVLRRMAAGGEGTGGGTAP
jgi:acyl-CoA synthetase (AMP-forming)/AMP-acid ligase II